jgi:predicted nucleotidyltransferase component of viral defense system
MDLPSLPPETERLWNFFREQTELAGFVLVGGTALALRIHHRSSEDLDFAWGGSRLPAALDVVVRHARDAGHQFTRHDNPVSDDEFVNAGMELHHYQQDFLVNGTVKVSFFSADPPLASVLAARHDGTRPRIAELEELFESKSLVSAARSKTRDWFDLFTLMRSHDFSMRQFRESFTKHGAALLFDYAMRRICSGVPQADDEGYHQLVSGKAPSVEEMRDFFRAQRDCLEVELAAEAKRSGGK